MIVTGSIRFSDAVDEARAKSRPIVALESSVLAQGLPIPANREACRRMVAAIQARGATPAITAISRGVPTIGLGGADLERFLGRDGIRKVSSRDLGVAIAQCADGATTVAASLTLLGRAGLEVFATGGIGGVHRTLSGSTASAPDESADLLELARTAAVVVCAGPKSILDLPATWERLETLGIPVVGFRTSELPGFFTAETGIQLSTRADEASEIAAIARAHWELGNRQSVVVVQPPPTALSLDGKELSSAINRAMEEAETKGIKGAAVTPFLLEAVSRFTSGRSLETNLGLLEQNASLAAEIAVALRADAAR